MRRLRAAGCVFAEEEAEMLATGGDRVAEWIRRREAGEPLEHIVGRVRFAGCTLSVGPGVFVPRQRSARLAELAVARTHPGAVLLEVCAGVAPIAGVVARARPGVQVHATDVSAVACAHARVNLPAGAGVYCGNLLEPVPAAVLRRVTLLVAVAPYVPLHTAELMPHEAREHEPAEALFGGADGLDVVRALVTQAAGTPRVLLELGGGQIEAATEHARRAGFAARRHEADGHIAVLELVGQ